MKNKSYDVIVAGGGGSDGHSTAAGGAGGGRQVGGLLDGGAHFGLRQFSQGRAHQRHDLQSCGFGKAFRHAAAGVR